MIATAVPRRIQRRRIKGWSAADASTSEHGYRYVGRGTRYGNPWVVVETPDGWAASWTEGARMSAPPDDRRWAPANSRYAGHEAAVYLYAEWIADQPKLLAVIRGELAARDLLCWCPPALPCHADVLLAAAAGEDPAICAATARTRVAPDGSGQPGKEES